MTSVTTMYGLNNLTIVPELFPGLKSFEMRSIIAAAAEKRARRARMDLEDAMNSVRWPIGPLESAS